MKTRKLLDRLTGFLDGSTRQRNQEKDDLKTVLKKLKEKELKLRKHCDEASGEERKKLEQEARIVHAQRKKGVRLLKSKK